ncbi:hypothetical protein [Brevundimonas sp.]|uniref:hypothetical protein n=1 Tax=Brevundimonas sp. TaxID=1871086 RepID=UPI001A337CA0|nr:hypothetical protein [Brevundimonas sp.]MBJ7485434.1 hypothetical protein [Brevundimonas sp.]
MQDLICEHVPFCVAREYVAASEISGGLIQIDPDGRAVVASPVAVEATGVRVQFVGNDNLTTIDPARLKQTCIDGACVVFRSSCINLVCTWHIGPLIPDGPTYLQEVRLVGSDARSIARGMENVFISVHVEAGNRKISLAQLGTSAPAPAGTYTGPYTTEDRIGRRRP